MKPITDGRPSASIWIIGEAPGVDEIATGRPFVGMSGRELDRMLAEVGIRRSDCFLTNVTHERPPNNDISSFFARGQEAAALGLERINGLFPKQPIIEGLAELRRLLLGERPEIIICLGNTPLWALCQKRGTSLLPEGISKWRGSELVSVDSLGSIPTLPTFHPAFILRDWASRPLAISDLRRALSYRAHTQIPSGVAGQEARERWQFLTSPTLDQARGFLTNVIDAADRSDPDHPVHLACDIETRRGHIACVGLATSRTRAASIPFLCHDRPSGYFDLSGEHEITLLLRRALNHPHTHLVFQNGAYDLQYFAYQWGYVPKVADDTMLMSHICFPDQQKDLGFLASLHCERYCYWKDDGKEWDERLHREDQLWRYNCEDCCRTFEIRESLSRVIDALHVRDQYNFQMHDLFPVVVRMMLRGIKVDSLRRSDADRDLTRFALESQTWINESLGHTLNCSSTPQMKSLFYEDFRQPVILDKKTKKPTLSSAALESIAGRQPLLRPLITAINDMKSAQVVQRNTTRKPLSEDGRIRCTFNLGGTNTFRFSSSEDVFGTGTNLQNITKGDE
jgi:DNA polymerase